MGCVLVTGGAGFIGSHVVEFYARTGREVVVLDNLSRYQLLGRMRNATFNWEFLEKIGNVRLVKGSVTEYECVWPLIRDADVIVHAAAQTAVTTSFVNPKDDFHTNIVGTFNVLEAARRAERGATIIFCSTNKVYGDNVNQVPIVDMDQRYMFAGEYKKGIPETFSVDHTKHTPYGCSKLSADLYAQEYGRLYRLRVGIFRMSCIYGTRQFGVEDQGWLAWFAIAMMKGQPITIYGDGKQVRDVLFVSDLVAAYNRFVESELSTTVLNMGGGVENTLSLLEALALLSKKIGRTPELKYDNWRPSDQKVYISDISLAQNLLDWAPRNTPDEGIDMLVRWVRDNVECF